MNNLVRVRYHTRLDIVPQQDKVDFDLVDRKDRRIGYSWCIEAVEVQKLDEGANSYYWQKPELANLSTLWRLTSSVTRDRRSFGAAQRWQYFATYEEAKQAVAKKAEASRRRYAAVPQDQR